MNTPRHWIGEINDISGTAYNSAVGSGSRSVGNVVDLGTPQQVQDLRAQLDELLAVLDREHGLDDGTLRTARYEITRIQEATAPTPDVPAIRTRWAAVGSLLAGAAPVSEHLATIVQSIGDAVGALLPG